MKEDIKRSYKDKMYYLVLLALTFTLNFITGLLTAVGIVFVMLTLLGYVTFKV